MKLTALPILLVLVALLGGCGNGSPTAPSGPFSASISSATSAASVSSSTGAGGSGGGSSSPGSGGAMLATSTASGSGGGGIGGGSAAGPIGVWTDAPGACPAGLLQVDITDMTQLASAARGQDAYESDAPATCYFIHNGDYMTTGSVFYVLKGGEPGAARRYFIGESRTGVVIHGRGTVEDGVSDVTLSNLTFDLTGYVGPDSFNTLGIGSTPDGTGKNITVDHVTFTGDCMTGANGGHIEINSGDGVLVEACILEKFGRCGPLGHQDHGVYLANGKNLVFDNNLIRGNASRGIQMFTNGGLYGTLDGVTIQHNRIYENGHADYEDGIVINASGTGDITDVTIRNNILDHNFYSGIRFVGGLESSVTVASNTLDTNGVGSTADGRSEINIDSAGGGAGTTILRNLFNVGHLLINDCYDAATLGFGIGDNFVNGDVPSGAAANCVSGPLTLGDPRFVNAGQADYHPMNPAAASYGAYAP